MEKNPRKMAEMLNKHIMSVKGPVFIASREDLSEELHELKEIHGGYIKYYNPICDNSFFNPLDGSEEDAIYKISYAFNNINSDMPDILLYKNKELITNSIIMLKRLLNEPNLENLLDVVTNRNNQGELMVQMFNKEENSEKISEWFEEYYFDDDSNIYDDTEAFRYFLSTLLVDKNINNIFTKNDFNFKEIVDMNGAFIVYVPKELEEAGAILLELILLSFEFEIDKN